MKLIIAGGRRYQFTPDDFLKLYKIRTLVSEVVSGHSGLILKDGTIYGADLYGEAWAKTYNIPVTPFPANWKKYGNAAGPIRNKQMARYADALAIFPGGTGSADMLAQAQIQSLKIYDFQN